MKAIRIHEHGSVEVLKIDDLSTPDIQPDEVLVKIRTAALNHLDIFVRNGIPGVPLPLIMGSDGAGEIVDTGKLVRNEYDFRPGDEIITVPIRSCGKCGYCLSGEENLCREFKIPGEHIDGTQAEYIAVPAKYILRKPKSLSWDDAAAFPLAAMTAYHMLTRKTSVKSGDILLIYGASSGVGSAAIQFAKAKGATVITTAGSPEKMAMAKKLGADHVIDYKNKPVGKTVKELTAGRGVDTVIEHTGAATWPDSLRSLSIGGKIVTCGATTGPYVKIDLRALFIKHQQLIGSTMGTRRDLIEICDLIDQGKFKPLVDGQFQFSEIKDAHQRLESGSQSGKVVIRFD